MAARAIREEDLAAVVIHLRVANGSLGIVQEDGELARVDVQPAELSERSICLGVPSARYALACSSWA